MENKVVARYLDGRVLKGTTSNFAPMRDHFHVVDLAGGRHEVFLRDLKALFFVKTFEGKSGYRERRQFGDENVYGRKVRCAFDDGEVIVGYTQGYDANRPGFFVTPVDPESNNERVFVINSASLEVETER